MYGNLALPRFCSRNIDGQAADTAEKLEAVPLHSQLKHHALLLLRKAAAAVTGPVPAAEDGGGEHS
jgi:hypothetical protein